MVWYGMVWYGMYVCMCVCVYIYYIIDICILYICIYYIYVYIMYYRILNHFWFGGIIAIWLGSCPPGSTCSERNCLRTTCLGRRSDVSDNHPLHLVWHAEVIATFLAGRWGLGHQFWVRSFKCWSWHLCNLVNFSNFPSFVSVIHPSSSNCWGWTIFWVPAVHVWQLSVAWLIDTCPLDADV